MCSIRNHRDLECKEGNASEARRGYQESIDATLPSRHLIQTLSLNVQLTWGETAEILSPYEQPAFCNATCNMTSADQGNYDKHIDLILFQLKNKCMEFAKIAQLMVGGGIGANCPECIPLAALSRAHSFSCHCDNENSHCFLNGITRHNYRRACRN